MHADESGGRRDSTWHAQPCKCCMAAVLTMDGTVRRAFRRALSVGISGKGRRYWRRRNVAWMMTKSPTYRSSYRN